MLVLHVVVLVTIAYGFEILMDDVLLDEPLQAFLEHSAADIIGAQNVPVRRAHEVAADGHAGYDLHLNNAFRLRQLVRPPPL